MSTAYVFLADGFEEVEALTAVDLLRRAGVDVKTVSISDSEVLHGRSHINVTADLMWEDAKPDAADMLILPGGMPGTTYLMNHKGLGKALKRAVEEERFVAAICAAPTVLGALGILKGRKATCYPGMEDQLGGAEVVLDKEVVRDGCMITSRGAGTSIAFALRLIKVLEGEERAEAVAKSIVYRA